MLIASSEDGKICKQAGVSAGCGHDGSQHVTGSCIMLLIANHVTAH